jgi:hypothetical protein
MEARYLVLDDHKTLLKWWADNRFGQMGLDDLPMVNGQLQGLMVTHQGVEICAGFIIDTTIKNGAMIEYIVANFDVKDRPLRKKALNHLLDMLCEVGKTLGKKYVYTSVKNHNLINRYNECGFTTGSMGTVEMIKVLA